MNSVDMLEECLDMIYKIRKTSLNKRVASDNHSHSHRPVYIQKQVSQSNGSNLADVSSTNSKTSASGINSRMMSEFNEFYQISSNNSDDRSVKFLDRKLSVAAKLDATSSSSSNSTNKPSVHPSVIATLQDLKSELKDWWANSATSKRGNDEAREEFADYLTEKYMCQKLDLLPPSELISKIRKEVCNSIENFAMDGSINFRKLDLLVQQAQSNVNPHNESVISAQKANNHAISQKQIFAQTTDGSASNTGSTLFSKTVSQVEKKDENNKAKLRDQYAAYLKNKGVM